VHYVYVLRSVTDGGFYIGYSANLRERFKQHSQSNSFATAYRGPWKLFYYEAYLEQSDALGCEKYLKSGGGRRYLRSQLKNYFKKHPSRETA
jgi:putative endonuclease